VTQTRASKKTRSSATRASRPGLDFKAFVLRLLLLVIPIVLVWMALTPSYNSLLTSITNQAIRLSEDPTVTTLTPAEKHYFLIHRRDLQGRGRDGSVNSVRVTDTHFPVIFATGLILAMPGVPLARRLRALAWVLAILFLFHLVSLFFWVKFTYATQLGSWSTQNYSVAGQRFWGLGKHLLDLPFKFAMPLILWSIFFVDRLLPTRQD
jgi:hypothetical protein